jgi:hypothetical protein
LKDEYTMRLIAGALCALMFATPVGAAVNLIADGDFETNPAEQGGYGHYAGGASFDGGHWFVTGVDILHVDTAYHAGSSPPLVFTAQSGRNSLDLTGSGNSGPADGVYQDIATVAGQAYDLSFFVGRASSTGSVAGDYPSAATMRLSIGGGAVMEFVNDTMIDNRIAWTQFTTSFVATGSTTRIAFLNGLGNDYLGLDDVRLTSAAETPEPASWAMMLGGFGAIGGALRSQRRKVRPA